MMDDSDNRSRSSRQNRCSNREHGATLVEYAFVLLLIFPSIFGIIDFGRALYTYHFVSNAARDGTRFAIVRGYTCDQSLMTTACPASPSDYQAYLRNQMPATGLDPNAVTADTTWPVLSGSPPVCSLSGYQNYPGCTVQVTVTYAFKFIFPLMPRTTINMTSTSQMVISQ
jgi:Flp pilus assembly protein TadG